MNDNYQVEHIAMERIYSDNNFNCRGTIAPMDVVDLARDIDANGLQFPIAVQPAADVENGLPDGFDFRIVAGHRRFAAFRVLKRTDIPAMIKTGLTEISARLLNLGENLKRCDLNILQEARAVEYLHRYGLVQENIARSLGMSRGWVQVRLLLLELPENIQEEAAAGFLNQYQIRQVHELKNPDRQYEAVRKIKMARISGDKTVHVGVKPKDDPFKKKRQPKTVVQEMIDHLGQTIGFGLHTRVLAWANGEINTAELDYDIRKYAVDHNIEYIPLVQRNG